MVAINDASYFISVNTGQGQNSSLINFHVLNKITKIIWSEDAPLKQYATVYCRQGNMNIMLNNALVCNLN